MEAEWTEHEIKKMINNPELVTTQEFAELKACITVAYDYLENLQRVHRAITGVPYVGYLGRIK